MPSFEFIGNSAVTKLARDLELGSAEAATQATKLVRDTARQIRDDARGLVPVDTGALRSSITYRSQGKFSAEVGPTEHYGHYVEYGTSKMPPQPFLGPATDRNEPRFIEGAERIGSHILDGG